MRHALRVTLVFAAMSIAQGSERKKVPASEYSTPAAIPLQVHYEYLRDSVATAKFKTPQPSIGWPPTLQSDPRADHYRPLPTDQPERVWSQGLFASCMSVQTPDSPFSQTYGILTPTNTSSDPRYATGIASVVGVLTDTTSGQEQIRIAAAALYEKTTGCIEYALNNKSPVVPNVSPQRRKR